MTNLNLGTLKISIKVTILLIIFLLETLFYDNITKKDQFKEK